jgi:hypothetical protein
VEHRELTGDVEPVLAELERAEVRDRLHELGEDLDVLGVLTGRHPVPVLALDDVPGVREVQRPSAVEHGPSEVIVVDVRDDHRVDLAGLDAGLGELDREPARLVGPRERWRRDRTEPGVDHDRATLGAEREAVDVQPPVA